MARKRTTITVDEDILAQAKDAGLNISQTAERALREGVNEPQYHFVNTNKSNLPTDGTEIYQHGITATYGPREDYGVLLDNISVGDFVASYVKQTGIRALGKVTGVWNGEPVSEDDQLYPKDERYEYHLSTAWIAVLPSDKAVTPVQFRQITGKEVPSWTYQSLSSYNPELLMAVIKGRAY